MRGVPQTSHQTTPDAGCHDLRADITMQLCPRLHSTHTNCLTHTQLWGKWNVFSIHLSSIIIWRGFLSPLLSRSGDRGKNCVDCAPNRPFNQVKMMKNGQTCFDQEDRMTAAPKETIGPRETIIWFQSEIRSRLLPSHYPMVFSHSTLRKNKTTNRASTCVWKFPH